MTIVAGSAPNPTGLGGFNGLRMIGGSRPVARAVAGREGSGPQ